RNRAGKADGLGRRREREARDDDGITGPHAVGHERHQQRVGTARTRDRVADAYVRGEPFLELGHLGPENEGTVLEHAGDGGLDPATETMALADEIDERDVRHPPIVTSWLPCRRGGNMHLCVTRVLA